ncbi:TPA: molecular chaperone DnaJ [Klebsiella pneumoniae]|nr:MULTISPECIES: DnaJ domain-containing protein [Klebsiella]MBC4425500.1 DnaJ domain-containing protein [Klebsiella variicola]MBK2797274.1 molecular chaperone DnaJ [Klebsiella pneumoniae]MCC4959744.1 DnaJ domain-containing protein [Klebsiella pneumoniae]MCD7089989.1 DnaJ domain-containing protein [Klebsiella quasipneumoniae subsp. quasipneumoniae]OUY91585.1 molecular chaperone DnaJ [Klebsiella variicola]
MTIQEALNVLNLSGDISEKTLKTAFKKMALKFHPDRNPLGAELMKAVNAAFEFLMENIAIINDVKSKDDKDFYNYSEELEAVLKQLAELAGIEFEVMGNWIWIDGDTKAHKEALKAMGCKWASKKKKWFYRPEEHKSRFNRSEMSMEMIREKYGSSGNFKGRKGQKLENRAAKISA